MSNVSMENVQLMMVDKDGNQTYIDGAINIEPEPIPEITDYDYKGMLEVHSTTYSFELSNYTIKKYSKKKFIKLLMSKGIQRNEANAIVTYCRRLNKPFTDLELGGW